MEYVLLVEGREYGKLKKALEADPYDKQGFAAVGYTLKESKALGLKRGNYVLYYKVGSSETSRKLGERLKGLETAKGLEGAEKEEIVKKIQREQDSAAAGFGNIFG